MDAVSDAKPAESDLARQEEEIRAALSKDPRFPDTLYWLQQLKEILPHPPVVQYVISTSGTSGTAP